MIKALVLSAVLYAPIVHAANNSPLTVLTCQIEAVFDSEFEEANDFTFSDYPHFTLSIDDEDRYGVTIGAMIFEPWDDELSEVVDVNGDHLNFAVMYDGQEQLRFAISEPKENPARKQVTLSQKNSEGESIDFAEFICNEQR